MPTVNLSQLLPKQLGHIPFTAQAWAVVELVRQQKRPVLHISPQDKDAACLAELVRFLAPELPLYVFPAWDTLPYDRISPAAHIQSQRLAVLGALAQKKDNAPYILLTTLNAATQYIPPKELLKHARFEIKRGKNLDREALFRFLTDNGYQRVSKVMEAGEYAVRGSLIDLFPSGSEDGVRIDLFDTEVESIKRFDPLTQLSDAALDMLELRPVSEVLLTPDTIARFRERYRELFGAVTRDDPLYEAISAGRTYAGMEHWLPLFYEKLDSLSDYTPGAIIASDHRNPALHKERWEAITDYYNARLEYARIKDASPYHPVPPEQLFMDQKESEKRGSAFPFVRLTPFNGDTDLPLKPSPELHHRRQEETNPHSAAITYIAGSQKRVIIAANSTGSAERIKKLLHIEKAPTITSLAEATAPISLTILAIEKGFEASDFVLLSEEDLFGERIIRTQKRKKKSEAFLQEASSFIEGELIVHREHGIGKFDSLVTVEVNDTRHDCLKLMYDGGDKLFLPVENIDLVSRYGTSDGPVPLDKLGGVAWQKRKSALKKRLRMAAEALLKVAAERAAKPAPVMAAESGTYDEFCARFPYTETDDQLQAIEDVRADLASGHAMDRLICGDVGFGKTEVALRAAFIAASGGHQVAIIAPTTLLARQHYYTFSERFTGLPFNIQMLSRLVGSKQAAETKKQIAEGGAQIIIGTHALLGAGVQFKNLGLLVVDEEQHFGVTQKEKLKQLKSDVHVLTLSATPIPRTLQMALSGVRELSLITTAPLDRLAVRSYVMPYDPVIVREALLREHHRGGKSFYVTPRIKYMAELKQKLTELVPEIKIASAHGQMAPTVLDKTMNEFYDGKYDLLLSTAIIESGIDIPTANTMIIDHSEMLGLAQLYQLRGRVGRSKQRAYAYLTLPHQKKLTREAERRLEVMQQLDQLGAGFALASHDMDIRGFGNLLGEEQSGHIKEVGIELYQSMLEETVAELKRRRHVGEELPDEAWSPQLNLGMSVLIPESYIEDLPLRLSLYRRAASLGSATDIDAFAAELIDRFGAMPQEVEHFLAVLAIKLQAKQAGIARMDAGPKGVVIAFRDNKFAAPEALIAHIAKNVARIKLRADQTIFIAIDLTDGAARLSAANNTAQEIVALLPQPRPEAA